VGVIKRGELSIDEYFDRWKNDSVLNEIEEYSRKLELQRSSGI